MIVIRYREDPTSAIVTGAAIVLMLASLGFLVFAPRPTYASIKRKQEDRTFKARLATQTAEKKAADGAAYVTSHTWIGKPEDVSPAALARVSSVAKQLGLNLVSFRPQKAPENTTIPLLPMLATLDGSYPQVLAFAKSLETTGGRLVVTSIMISSADTSSDRVTANVGLLAFINAPTAPASTAGTKTTVEVKTNA